MFLSKRQRPKYRVRAALLTLLALSGALAAVPSPAALPNLPSGFGPDTLVVLPTPSAPTVDGAEDAVWAQARAFEVTAVGGSGNFPQGAGIRVRALYDATTLFVLVEWPDATQDYSLDAWQLVDNSTAAGSWVRSTWGDDGVSFFFDNGTGLEQNFSAQGCGALCHTGTVQEMGTTGAGTVDLWSWSSSRSAPLGYVDDLYLDNASKLEGSPTGGVHGDAPDPFQNNTALTAYGDRPAFLNGSVPTTESARHIADADKLALDWLTFNSTSLPNGTTVPGYVLAPPTAGRADLPAAAVYTGAGWRVEFARPFDTGDNTSRDVPIVDLNLTYFLSVAVLNNRTGQSHSQANLVTKVVFADNVLPDLVPRQVVLEQPSTLIGEPVNLTVIVRNNGFGNSTQPVAVAVVDDLTALQVAGGLAPPISWNEEFFLNLSFSSVGYLPGAYNFTATVDSAGVENESFEGNNSLTFAVTFVSLIAPADLVLETVTGPAGTVFAGEPFVINGTVRNAGAGDSVFNVTVRATHPSAGTLDTDLGPLLSGASANYSFTFDSTGLSTGTYAFQVTVDPDNAVVEPDENNSMPVAVDVESRPNLLASGLLADPATGLEGATLNLTLSVRNTGAAFYGTVSVSLYLDDPLSVNGTNRTDVWSVPLALARGASQNFSANWSIPVPMQEGYHILRAWVDAGRAVDELLETDNNASVQLAVQPPLTPDLTVKDAALSATSYRVGQTGTVTVVVANLGVDYTGNITLSVREATANVTLATASFAPIPGGANRSFTLTFTLPPSSPGSHTISAIVDPEGLLVERGAVGELNNAFDLPYTLLAAPVFDLTVDSLAYEPPGSMVGAQVTLVAVVRNVGNATSGATSISFRHGTRALGSVSVPSLTAGGSFTALLAWDTSYLRALAALVQAEVNVPNLLGEPDVSNNFAEFVAAFVPAGAPSLHLSSPSASPSSVAPGTSVRLEVRVTNNGTAEGAGFVVFRVDGAEVDRQNFTLLPNASVTLAASWVATSPGNHTARFELNLSGGTAESTAAVVTVVAPPPPGQVPASFLVAAALAAVGAVAALFVWRARGRSSQPKEPPSARDPASAREKGGAREEE